MFKYDVNIPPLATARRAHNGILRFAAVLLLLGCRSSSVGRRGVGCACRRRGAANPAELDLAFDSGYLLVRDAEEELLGRLTVLKCDLCGRG